MWMAYAAGSAVFAALVAIFGKLGLRGVDPTLATIVRGVIMAALLVVAGIAFRKFEGFGLDALHSRAWLFVFLAAIAGALSWICYFIALQTGPAGAVAVIDKLSVVLVLIAAALFLGESFTLATAAGAALIVAGSVLVLHG